MFSRRAFHHRWNICCSTCEFALFCFVIISVGESLKVKEVMVSKCFFLLLLFPVAWCDATVKRPLYLLKRDLTPEEKCATQDVMWGWLNVVNQPALRAEAVKRNVSEVMQKAREVREKADAAITEYKKILVSLDPTSNEKEIEAVDQAIADVNKSIERADQSEQKASKATKQAEESITSSTHCFNAIMRVARYLWAVDSDGTWNYASVKETFDVHDTDDCKKKYNVSKILNNTGNIDTMNLTLWVNNALSILQRTYNDIKSNKEKYHWSVTASDDKINEVKKAVVEAVGRLEVAVKNFDSYRVAVSDAKEKLENASRQVGEINNLLLASVSGKMFCEVVGRLSKSNEGLRALDKNLTNEKQNAVDALTESKRVQVEVAVADELVKEVGTWLEGNYLALVHKLSGTHDVTEANDALSTSVRSATEANTIVNEVQQNVKTQSELLERVRTEMVKMSDAAGNKINDATFEMCSGSVSEILKSKFPDVIRSIAMFNTTLLTELNVTLHKIDGEADMIEHKLSGVNKQVQGANSSARGASACETSD
ncbi:hypothetical protein TRVL_07068 [Trypanosoma vivax]|nr:hypothetical protein TRVL_07068 [Trypanosoma vivax]